jgi:ATP-binding cassette, subfamily B, bacterial
VAEIALAMSGCKGRSVIRDRKEGGVTRTGQARPISVFRSADRLLLRVVRQAGYWLVVVLLAEVGCAAAVLWAPLVMADAVDATLQRHEPLTAQAKLSGALALEAAAGLLIVVAGARISSQATAWLRRRLLEHVLALGTTGQRRYGAGSLTSRLIGDVTQVTSTGPMVIGALAAAVTAVGGVIAVGLIDWRVAVTLIAGLAFAWLAVRTLLTDSSVLFVRYRKVLTEIADRLDSAFAGVRTIRASGTVTRETQRVLTPLPELSRAGYDLWQVQRRSSFQLGLAYPLIWLAVLAVAGFGITAGRVTPGEFLASSSYAMLALGLLDHVDGLLQVARARAGAARVGEILSEDTAAPGRASLPPGPGELTLQEVEVRTADRILLDHVNLRVPPGTAVALVGTGNSGKSTLAMVAGGLTAPDDGEVCLDGVPLADIAPAERCRAIAYAFERPKLLGETIADAIGYGAPGISRAAVERAARVAHADEFIRRLPRGYDTPLHHAAMSGGEAQRLGLARAIACDARVTVFDDATSSLDVATEMLVSTAITEQLAGRTRIVVTHRASTAGRTDLVAWLEDGRIRALAPHAQLWRLPDYRAVFGHNQAAP